MRKIIVITTIIILVLVLTGCGNRNIKLKQEEPNPKTTQQAGNDTHQQGGNDTSQQPNAKDSSPDSTSIVAKSENIMSSSEKEALLNQVDKELDSLFSNINNLEDAQDADLDLNQK